MYFNRLLHSQKNDEISMREYLLKIKPICDNLANCGEVISGHEHVTTILNDLPAEYDSIITVLTAGSISSNVYAISTVLLDADARQTNMSSNIMASAHLAQNDVSGSGVNLNSANIATVYGQSSGYSESGKFSRDNNRGRGRGMSSRPQCQLCGRMRHLVEHCYYRIDMSFKIESTRNDSSRTNSSGDRKYSTSQANLTTIPPFTTLYYSPMPTIPHSYTQQGVVHMVPQVAVPYQSQTSYSPQARPQALIATPEVVDDNSWYSDSGASHHLTNDFSMQVRNDNTLPIHFRGFYRVLSKALSSERSSYTRGGYEGSGK
ncbi:hypothetical protein F3Y22_tig00002840pilonHSYRG01503 [Hibiscus syriacus]|uniref:Uncharacterized protein n=1 Tax=Hibiscus syriacus TaxID=106335 RepID=A0A6A3CW18_HIBSY|nr:hypothetical protein F3Y22_tig00002840pilonHSYRG01503 [Hibiscus syriacus]